MDIDANWCRERNARERGRRQLALATCAEEGLDLYFSDLQRPLHTTVPLDTVSPLTVLEVCYIIVAI